jgi:hypothetical protein
MPHLEADQSKNVEPNSMSLTWTQEAINKLRILESSRPEGMATRDEAHWRLIEEILSNFETQSEKLIEHLEEQCSLIFDNSHQEKVGAQLRGYFFENLSRSIPIGDQLIINTPSSGLMEKLGGNQALEQSLEGLSQKTIFELKAERPSGEKLAWDKGAIIAREISQQLLEELRDKGLAEAVFIYVPALDSKFQNYRQQFDSGKVVIRFDPKSNKWIAEAKSEEKAKAQQHWADKASQINQRLNSELTLPDAVIFDGQEVRGVVETKCWHTEEVAALVERMETQPSEQLGGQIKTLEIDLQRLVEDKGKSSYGQGVKKVNLVLRLTEEIAFVERSLGKKIDNPMVVVRLPGNIPPDVVEDLQEQLQSRGINWLLIQQILLDAEEIELLASEFIHSNEFVHQLNERFGSLSGKNRGKNIKARMLALKLTSESLKSFQVSDKPDKRDRMVERLKTEHQKYFKS